MGSLDDEDGDREELGDVSMDCSLWFGIGFVIESEVESDT